MKILTLNTWTGRLHEPLFQFIKEKSTEIDVFCFQEVHDNPADDLIESPEERPNLFEEIANILQDFQGHFTEQLEGTGIAVFVRKGLDIERTESHIILSSEDLSHTIMPNGRVRYPRALQAIFLKNPQLTIYNFHGVLGDGKKDNPDRELQMKRLLQIMNGDTNSKVLVGDFNLNPDTQAISIIEENMTNLVTNNSVKTTRNNHYSKVQELPFADYIFTSPKIQVKDFQVLPDEVSDHLALEVKIKLQ